MKFDNQLDAITHGIYEMNKNKASYAAMVTKGPNKGRYLSMRYKLVKKPSALTMVTSDRAVWDKMIPEWVEPLENWEIVQVAKAKGAK